MTILMAITRDPSLAPPSGRLRPLLVGRPHPKLRMGRWYGDGVVRSVARHLTRFWPGEPFVVSKPSQQNGFG